MAGLAIAGVEVGCLVRVPLLAITSSEPNLNDGAADEATELFVKAAEADTI